MVFGCAAVPDAALTLDIRSSSGCLNYRYREDLWGAPRDSHRNWEGLLRLSWEAEAWNAYSAYFSTFELSPSSIHIISFSQWNTWGEYRFNIFETRRMIDIGYRRSKIRSFRVRRQMGNLPFQWCPQQEQRSLILKVTLPICEERGMKVGLWQAVGWLDKPEEAGLTNDDLLCGVDGKPRRTGWSIKLPAARISRTTALIRVLPKHVITYKSHPADCARLSCRLAQT